jgi:RND family efflux transporter MFP subunit
VFRSISLALVTATFVAACADEAPERAPKPRAVMAEPVELRDAVDRLELQGDVHGSVEVQVVASVGESIRTLHVASGDEVEAGDPIATLSDQLPGSELAEATAALRAASSRVDRLTGEVERGRRLVERESLAPSQLESLEGQLATAEAEVERLRAIRQAAAVRNARTVIRAPEKGVVARLQVDEGEVVAPGAPVCSIVQMDPVEVVLSVVEPDFVRLSEGMAAEVSPSSLPGVRKRGVIRHIAPVLDRRSRTGVVKVEVDNPDRTLRPGMVAEVRVELSRRNGVPMVPGRAVLMTTRTDTDGEAEVFLVSESKALRKPVRLGKRYDDRIEIAHGVEAGDRVIVEGQHLLRDGSPIRVRPSARAQADPDAEEASSASDDAKAMP